MPFALLSALAFPLQLCSAAVFLIESPPDQSRNVQTYLERHLDKLSSVFAIELTDTVRVVIADDQRRFSELVGNDFPDWGAAAALKERALIIIRPPEQFPGGKTLDELLGHELCHLAIDKACGGRWLPRWFEEGLCQMLSGEWRISQDVLLTRAVWGSGLLPLISLESVNWFGSAKAALAYAQSYQAVVALTHDFGIDFYAPFFESYRQSGDFYGTFFNLTGYRYLEWVNKWQSETTRKYRFVLFIFDSQLLFLALPVFFLLIYAIKKIQSRRKLKEWERLEKLRHDGQEYTPSD